MSKGLRVNLWGSPLDGMHRTELQHWIDRAMELGADALNRGDRVSADMYQYEMLQLLSEKVRPGSYRSRHATLAPTLEAQK